MVPLQQTPALGDEVQELVETAIGIYEVLPFFVWLLLGFVAVIAVRRVVRSARRLPEAPGDDTIDRRRDPSGGAAPDYSIHDDVDVGQRDYREPSEYDEISTPNEVDRSLVSKIRTLIDLALAGRRGRD